VSDSFDLQRFVDAQAAIRMIRGPLRVTHSFRRFASSTKTRFRLTEGKPFNAQSCSRCNRVKANVFEVGKITFLSTSGGVSSHHG
jgi:hypothetical protein